MSPAFDDWATLGSNPALPFSASGFPLLGCSFVIWKMGRIAMSPVVVLMIK